MCGIAGLFSLNRRPVPSGALARMARAIRHRGPDEEGAFEAPGVALGIQRLRVIDLATGGQPMYNEARDAVVVHNGEIYNYVELRESLAKKGHVFSSRGDTETIVHLYEEYGDRCVEHMNGMFAFALYDAKRRRLLLARDRAGVKPLFYAIHDNRLVFASEIKAILADPEFPRDVDPEALQDYLSFYYVSAPRTIYKNIRRLPAGHLLVCEGESVREEPWWDLRFAPRERPLEEWKEEFRGTLEASVKRHLQSDVPLGVYLSGGLDSASLVAAMSRLGARAKTYSVGYEEESFSELAQARQVAARFGTEHHEVVLKAGAAQELLPEVLRGLDEPHGDWSSVPNFLLAREAKKSVTVVLSGTGGDELFGGYPTYLAAKAARVYRRLPSWLKGGLIKPMVEGMPASFTRMPVDFAAKSFLRGADAPSERAHQRFKEIFNDRERALLLTPEGRALLEPRDPFEVFGQYREAFQGMSEMDRLMYLDFKVFLPDCGLFVGDMTTSAHAVEGRVPFLDLKMIELAAAIPWRLKVRGWSTKYLMREALAPWLPPEIVRMKKKGFLIPGAPWIRGEMRPFLLEIVGRAENELEWLFDFAYVRRLFEEHFAQRVDHTRRIACLISFFLWHETARPSWNAKVTT